MRESKSELTGRLRRGGQWQEFVKRREELKASGMPAKDAWVQAADEFPAPSQKTDKATPPVDLLPLKGKQAVPIYEATKWVMENLDADWITPADAPSAGAWSMLRWARSSLAARGDFYRTFVSKLLPKGCSDPGAGRQGQESGEVVGGINAPVNEEDAERMRVLLGVDEAVSSADRRQE
jgi:hypothetical protein